MLRIHPSATRVISILGLVWAVTPALADEKPLRVIIDAEIHAAWERENITPAGSADDATFLRRIYLDLIGTIPNYDEAVQFLKDDNPEKRAKLIDRLLADPRFAAHQATVWDQVILGRNPSNGVVQLRESFRSWLTDKFAKNEPYDHWVRELLLAEESSQQGGGAIFYLQYFQNIARPEEAATAVSRIFLGTQLQCTQCHDDRRGDKWKQGDFWGFAAFFARLAIVEGAASGKPAKWLAEKSGGEVTLAKQPVPAKFLDGPALTEPPLPKEFKEPNLKDGKLPAKPLFSRKEKLVEWLTAAENPFFARAVVNRVWAQFLGRGLVNPVDDLADNHRASHPELFQAIRDQFVAHQFDLKWLICELVSSKTYQLVPTTDVNLPKWFERARVRPLSAEEGLAALREATGFNAALKVSGNSKSSLPGELGFWFPRYFIDASQGKGDFQANLHERLFMANNTRVRQLTQRQKGNLVDTLLTSTAPWEERVDRLFLSVLTRLPRPEERKLFVEHLITDPQQAESLLEEALWVLVNCSEFRFNR
jgi:hypothetical protein